MQVAHIDGMYLSLQEGRLRNSGMHIWQVDLRLYPLPCTYICLFFMPSFTIISFMLDSDSQAHMFADAISLSQLCGFYMYTWGKGCCFMQQEFEAFYLSCLSLPSPSFYGIFPPSMYSSYILVFMAAASNSLLVFHGPQVTNSSLSLCSHLFQMSCSILKYFSFEAQAFSIPCCSCRQLTRVAMLHLQSSFFLGSTCCWSRSLRCWFHVVWEAMSWIK